MTDMSSTAEPVQKPRAGGMSGIAMALLIVIGVLLVCNLGGTAYLIYQFQKAPGGQIASPSDPLPQDLSSNQARAELFEKIRTLYNAQDNEKFFALFDPLAQQQISREQIDARMPILFQMTGEIISGTYSHYEYGGYSDGRKWFELYYRIQTDNGIGTLTIEVAQDGESPTGIFGFNITLD